MNIQTERREQLHILLAEIDSLADGKSTSRLPYFRFYPIEFMHATRKFSNEARGAFMALLCEQWTTWYLPADLQELSDLLGFRKLAVFEKLWTKYLAAKFTEIDGKLYSHRLEVERRKVLVGSSGRKSGRRGQTPPNAVPTTPDDVPMDPATAEIEKEIPF